MNRHTDRQVPIICTSSDSRLGGTAVWSALLDSVAGEVPMDFSAQYRKEGKEFGEDDDEEEEEKEESC